MLVFFVARKHDADKSRGSLRLVGNSALGGTDAIVDEAQNTTASYRKSVSCDGDVSKQVSKDGQHNPAENKTGMQDVVAALPVGAKEPRIGVASTEGSGTTGVTSKMQTDAPRRLFQLYVKEIRDNVIEAAEKSSSETESACRSSSQTEDSRSSRNKRCKFSAESSATRLSAGDNKQFAAEIDDDSSGSASANRSDKKGLVKTLKAACNQMPPNVMDAKRVQSLGGKGRQNELLCSSARSEMAMTKDTPRSSNGRGDTSSAVAESQCSLRGIECRSEPYASSGTKRCNWSKLSVESVASGGADLKANVTPEQERLNNEQTTKSAKKGRRSRNRRNSMKTEVEDQVSQGRESGVKLNDGEKKADDNQMARCAQRGSRRNTRKMDVEDEASRSDFYSRNAHQRRENAQQSAADHKLSSSGVSCGRGRGSSHGKPRCFAGNHQRRDSTAAAHSTHKPSSSHLEKNWAAELDDHHRMRTDRDAGMSSIRTSLNANKHGGLKNSLEMVRVAEDWETELFVFPPVQQNVTVSSESVADSVGEMFCVEEVVTTSACDPCTAGSSECPENVEEVSARLPQQTDVSMDHNQHLASSGEVNADVDNGSEQIESQSYGAVENVTCVNIAEAEEACETSSTSLKGHNNIECEAGVSPAVNSSQLDTDKYDMQQAVSIALPGDARSSNLLSDGAEPCERYSASDDITEPYEIGADKIGNDDFPCPQSEKCSDKISSGKLYCRFIICFFNINTV